MACRILIVNGEFNITNRRVFYNRYLFCYKEFGQPANRKGGAGRKMSEGVRARRGKRAEQARIWGVMASEKEV